MNRTTGRFRPGDRVRVLARNPQGNPRTPAYVREKVGVISECHGVIVNPLDHHEVYPPLYSVRFRVEDLGGPSGHDLVTADIHDEWLEPA